MVYVLIGALLAALAALLFKSFRQQSESAVSEVLEADVKKAKQNSDQKVQEYKDAKNNFSARYAEYLASKRDGESK